MSKYLVKEVHPVPKSVRSKKLNKPTGSTRLALFQIEQPVAGLWGRLLAEPALPMGRIDHRQTYVVGEVVLLS